PKARSGARCWPGGLQAPCSISERTSLRLWEFLCSSRIGGFALVRCVLEVSGNSSWWRWLCLRRPCTCSICEWCRPAGSEVVYMFVTQISCDGALYDSYRTFTSRGRLNLAKDSHASVCH